MIAARQELLDVFQWLIRSSFQATVLLVLILFVRMLVRNRFQARMIYWLWVLLLFRLVWPLNLETTISVFNFVPAQANFISTAEEAVDNRGDSYRLSQPGEDQQSLSAHTSAADVPTEPARSYSEPGSPGLMYWLCMVWLTGAGFLAAYVVISHFRLWRIIKRERLITRQPILELLEDCKARLGLQTVIGIVETDKVTSPCLFGYLRPRLLLPAGALDELTQQQLRYVFVHELAHLKRHDILIGWLMAAVQVLHWFNPAVWFAMSQISSDRELACDELVLSHLGENESKPYGATILMFLERFARKPKLPAMAGIAENQSLLRRRISMIAKFKHRKISWVPAAALIVLLIGATFTSANPEQAASTQQVPTASAGEKPRLAGASRPEMLALDDGKSAGMESIAGGGHAIFMETDGKTELLGVRIYGSRYGTPQPPKENFYIWIADENQNVLETFEFPYATFKRGEPKWYILRTKPTRLPEVFYLCAGFNPEKTKGVYVHYDGQASGKSFIGLPHDNYAFKPFDRGDWMIRAMVRPAAGTGVGSEAGTRASDAGSVQALIDAAEEGATVEIPAGTYEQPIRVTKSLILKGASRDTCVFKVTANEPAIFIDTAGKGKVHLSNVTIKWQLAASDQQEHPFAVAIKDTVAEITGCVFRPLGNFQRSPVAVRSIGFSEMNLTDCDFEGFDYVVCYGETTKGRVAGCSIRNCGHQGVILYSGAEAVIEQNIITGSGFHAVRSTGGKLTLQDNLIINNKNRGVYLGNKSCSGIIENNVLIGNGTGIDAISASRFAIRNNVILKSDYSAISAIPQARLNITRNVIVDNPRGVIVHLKEGQADPVNSEIFKNVFWNNKATTENCSAKESTEQKPTFMEPGNGNFAILDPVFAGMGLKDAKIIFDLWQQYRKDGRQ